ncbi:MAG TPA: Z1 domain-containing protein [Acidothermaceae bacterium]|jgi:hypothetical protein
MRDLIEPIDPTERKKAMLLLEQFVTVSMQDQRIDEPELLDRLRRFNGLQGQALAEPDLETVARRLMERLAIDVDLGSVITSRDYEPWLEARKRDIDWGRWLAFKQLLVKQGRSLKVIDKTDELTDKILDLTGDPAKKGAWARRGLVLGDVQSGKTGTYLGLFNKAADAGFRLFILLAGNTEVLRQQTQARVDESFIGRDSSKVIPRKGANVTPSKHIGVGLIRKDLAQASGMTTAIRDFRQSSYEASNITVQTDATHPYVFVVKKNKHVLAALLAWLREQAQASGGKLAVPVLMLDDESDYASINTNSETDPTAINQAIRDVLARFSRSSYVAFTATPFANIFIDHGVENDLFPRDFVYSLEAPSNYVGSARTFGTTEQVRTDALTDLDDVEEWIPLGHKSQLRVVQLPASLTDAVDTFLLSNAIRDLRGDTDKPRAMLVNVSRFKAVQRQVFEFLTESVGKTRSAVELHHADTGTQHSVILRLRDRFETEYSGLAFGWDEVLQQLPKAISDVRVRLFNSDTDKRLTEEDAQWDRPARMIAVGGDVLSRGLTLEGLCVSYFYRRVTASDTLMQMGRWFGYRDGYEDLCRIWINADAADNYRFSSDSIDELRTDLRLMLRQNLTPEDFGLAVRKHPGALLITARNKMKNAQLASRTIGLAGRRLETTTLEPDHTQNRADLEWLIGAVELDADYNATRAGWHRWQSVDRELVAEFLARYGRLAPPSDPFFSGDTLSKWARSAKAEKLARWDIAIVNGTKGRDRTLALGSGRALPIPRRVIRRDGDSLRVSGSSRRLAGPTDLAQLLEPAVRSHAEEQYRSAEPEKSVPERIYYPHLARPALIIYPLVSEPPEDGSDVDMHHHVSIDKSDYVVALKVAIPGDTTKVRDAGGDVTYLINTVAQQNWLSEFKDSDDEDLDD